jgi:protoheme IX farnesyltransferase
VKILPVVDPSGRRTARQVLLWTAVLLPVSLLPALVGTAGVAYAAGTFVLTLLFLRSSLLFARHTTDGRARSLFLTSIGWLPAVLVLLVIDRV